LGLPIGEIRNTADDQATGPELESALSRSLKELRTPLIGVHLPCAGNLTPSISGARKSS
jgi:hypothetical protein